MPYAGRHKPQHRPDPQRQQLECEIVNPDREGDEDPGVEAAGPLQNTQGLLRAVQDQPPGQL